MREIKFRAWDGKRMTSDIRLEFAHGLRLVSVDDLGFGMIGDDKCELMQFTGLHDKNGKEIFEGDICRDWLVEEHPSDLIYSVGFKDGMFTLIEKNGYDRTGIWNVHTHLDVIGNFYENPELLTKNI